MSDIEYKVLGTYTTVKLVQVSTEHKEMKHQKRITFAVEGTDIPAVGDVFRLVPAKEPA